MPPGSIPRRWSSGSAHSDNSALVHNIDSALESVETILGAVLDISRLDTGAMKPRLTSVPLNDLLRAHRDRFRADRPRRKT